MLWIIPAWVLSLALAYLLGYKLHRITAKIAELEEVVKSKVDKQPEPEEPKSTLIDPTDPIQEALWERKVMMERLNGQDHEDN